MALIRGRVAALLLFALCGEIAPAQQPTPARDKVIIDTDIGDDVDDAYAVSLALASQELDVLGITTAWGDTATRARMVSRMLCETGRTDVAVHAGVTTRATSAFTQLAWAREGVPHNLQGDGVTYLLEQIKAHPGEITLIALGPLTNIGAAIDRDSATFSKLKRVVMMGGAVYRGYDKQGSSAAQPVEPEYNIMRDPKAAQKLFRSGVPIYMFPLDSTQIRLDDSRWAQLIAISTPMTDALQILTAESGRRTKTTNPLLFDAVAAAYAIDASSCSMTRIHIEVDDQGMTKPTPGLENAQACLAPNEDAFYKVLMPRLLKQNLVGSGACLVVTPQK